MFSIGVVGFPVGKVCLMLKRNDGKHEDDVADYATRMIKISDGKKVFDGLRKAYKEEK